MLGAKLVIKLFFVGYELYKQKAPSSLCVYTGCSKPSLIKYDQIKKTDIHHGRYITWTGNTNRFTDNRYSIFAAPKSR